MRPREKPEALDEDDYERPRPLFPIVALGAIALVFAVVVAIAGIRWIGDARTDVARPRVAAPQMQHAAERPVVQVLADPALLGGPNSRWWARFTADLPAAVLVDSVPAGRYTGAGDEVFGAVADRVPGGARAVVLAGGGADHRASTIAVVAAATQALGTVRERAPKATIVVVGPDGAGAEAARVRTALRAAARIVDATWVDPTVLEWDGATEPPVSSNELTSTRLVDGLARLVEKSVEAGR